MKTTLVMVPCSMAQEIVIEEHLFNGAQLVCVPNERTLIVRQVQEKYPGAKVVSAHLNLENARWEVTVEVSE